MKTFEELGVMPEICEAISEMGFEYPMPGQEEVIPYLLGNGNDVIALAQTGTGKTAAFGLPIIQKADPALPYAQALILSPTRELCLQIADDLAAFSKYVEGLRVVPMYGGTSSRIRLMLSVTPILSISSASSSTTSRTVERFTTPRSIRSMRRPGVATMICTPRRTLRI